MNKFFIDYQNGRKYYAYQYQNGQIKYIALNEEHIEALLSKILSENINKLVDHDNYTEIYFDNLSIIIDNLKIFYPEHNSNDKYFLILYDKIKEIEEKERIKKEIQ